ANPVRAASADGRRFLAVKDGVARVWDADARRPLSPPLRPAGVWFPCFGPDGQLVLTVDDRHSVRVCDAVTGRPRTAAVLAVGGRSPPAALTANGRRVITMTEDGRAQLWDGTTGRMLAGMDEHRGQVRHVGFSPDGQLAVSAGEDRAVRLWNSATGGRAR